MPNTPADTVDATETVDTAAATAATDTPVETGTTVDPVETPGATTGTEAEAGAGAATDIDAGAGAGAGAGAPGTEEPASSMSSLLSSGRETSPSDIPLDPQHDEYPVLHWLQEGGPSLWEAAKAMLGFAFNWFL